MLKIELDSEIIAPFTEKLTTIRIMIEDITFSIQLAFFVSTVFAMFVFIISLINLIFDYKTKILEARRGIFKNFNVDVIAVMEGSNFPGFIISSSIAGFFITLACSTLALSFLFWPLFWLFLWSK